MNIWKVWVIDVTLNKPPYKDIPLSRYVMWKLFNVAIKP